MRYPQRVLFGIAALCLGALAPPARAQLVIEAVDGGDCEEVGVWDAASKTCRLDRDVQGSFELDDDGLTLEATGFTVTSPGGGVGVALVGDTGTNLQVVGGTFRGFAVGIEAQGCTDVSVRGVTVLDSPGGLGRGIVLADCTDSRVLDSVVEGADLGIVASSSSAITIRMNEVRNARSWGILLSATDASAVERNEITNAGKVGIKAGAGGGNLIRSNEIAGGAQGIDASTLTSSLIEDNVVTGVLAESMLVRGSNSNTVRFNILSGGQIGFLLQAGSTQNLFVCNDSLVHGVAGVVAGGGLGNRFLLNNFLGFAEVGSDLGDADDYEFNHWLPFLPFCNDVAPNDGICDAAYMFPLDMDPFPLVAPVQWRLNPLLCQVPSGPPTCSTLQPPAVASGLQASPGEVLQLQYDYPAEGGCLSEVQVGGLTAIATWSPPQLIVLVPDLPPGPAPIHVEFEQGGVSASAQLTVLPSACANGLDDDGDGLIDLAADAGCESAFDASERSIVLPCDSGEDEDGDGAVDFPSDPGCASPASEREDPGCNDGYDNDGDGRIDHDGGASLDRDGDGFVDPDIQADTPAVGAADPQCVGAPARSRERAARSCGLGLELAVLVPFLAWRRRPSRGCGPCRGPRPPSMLRTTRE